jgi:hypothetical protein
MEWIITVKKLNCREVSAVTAGLPSKKRYPPEK